MKSLVFQTVLFLSLLTLSTEIYSQNNKEKVETALDAFCKNKGFLSPDSVISVEGEDYEPDNLFIEMGYEGIIDNETIYTIPGEGTVKLTYSDKDEIFARFIINVRDIWIKRINFKRKR